MTSIQPGSVVVGRGSGPNGDIGIVLGHGFTGSPYSIRDWADYLAGQGFTVALPLLPGHGTRWQDLARTSWQQWYGAYERAWDELARERAAVFAAGLSMGGTLALRLASHRPVAGAVVVNPALTTAPAARYAGLLRYAVRSVKAIGNDIKRAGVDEQSYPRTPVAAVHQLTRLIADTAGRLPAVTAPTLVFRSAVDHVVPESSLELIRSRIGSSLVEVVPLPDSYHVATLDNDAETIFARTAGFMTAHGHAVQAKATAQGKAAQGRGEDRA
ncbi:alpha/beta hydrolase [Arthrobacter mobilis]|uniref:Alpha/beta fold hydrolase n=1 Tax=Arthrobacter mobilis TaxID=2724944 RepID=A0A7X6HEK0_9MICC|nr:alpha/beta fold hydrolase [Arthrobacter mobilis]NKX54960.1 alpha/beta fold hydrolase [Arthrobacter mobilis]